MVALEVLAISSAGLRRRARASDCGDDESGFLQTLFAIADSGETPAAALLKQFHGAWEGNIDPVFRDSAY